MIKRLVLALLFVTLVGLLVPPVRQRIDPQIGAGRVWLGDKLEGPLSPVVNRYRQYKTESLISKSLSELARRRTMGALPPQPNELTEFLVRTDIAEEGRDAWGMPFVLGRRADSLLIISAGRDLTYETNDDIVRGMRYRDPRGARRGARR